MLEDEQSFKHGGTAIASTMLLKDMRSIKNYE
jgi:hypothetical protein